MDLVDVLLPVACFLRETVVILLNPAVKQVLPVQFCHYKMSQSRLTRTSDAHAPLSYGALCSHTDTGSHAESCTRVGQRSPRSFQQCSQQFNLAGKDLWRVL